jgi:DNA-binding IclR family transcriptional regulator
MVKRSAFLISDHGNAPDVAAAETDPSARAAPAVTRSVAILRLLARSRAPLGVNAIARQLEIVPSTCLHILRVLVAEGLVAVDAETKRYVLDAGVLTLARSALRQDGVPRIAQAELDALAARFSVTAIAVRVIGLKHMIVVAISRSDATFRLHVDVGSRFPALISATGRCLAAFGRHEEREIAKAFKALRWDAAPSYADWQADVANTRKAGFGIDRSNYIRGVTIAAAPVFGIEGWMTHAIVAVALSDQLPADGARTIGLELKAAAARVTEHLGGARGGAEHDPRDPSR